MVDEDEQQHKFRITMAIRNTVSVARTPMLPKEEQSAGVKIGEFVERLRLRIGVVEHPEQVFEQNNLARHVDAVVLFLGAAVAGPVHQLPEQRVSDNLRAHQVLPPRLPDVHGAERRGVSVAGYGGDAGLALFAAEGVPFLEHRLQLR